MGLRKKYSRSKRVIVEVHGVSFCIASPGNLEETFVSLAAFPRPNLHGEACRWDLAAGWGWPDQYMARESLAAHTLSMEPGVQVRYELGADHTMRFVASNSAAALSPRKRKGRLWMRGTADAEARAVAGLVVTEILRLEGLYTAHAAALEYKGGTVLICAPSGFGKSTLACAWAGRGQARFMSDDRCLLQRRNGAVWAGGIPEPIALNEGSRTLLQDFGMVLPRTTERREGKSLLNCRDTFVEISERMCPVRALVFLSQQMRPDEPLRVCPAGEAAQRLLESSLHWTAKEVLREHFETLLDVIRQVPVFLAPARPKLPDTVNQLEERLSASSVTLREAGRPVGGRTSPDISAHGAQELIEVLGDLVWRAANKGTASGLDLDGWRNLLKLAEHHELLPRLGRVLDDTGLLAGLPNGLQNVVRAAREQALASRHVHLKCLGEIAHEFKRRGLRWCVLKGPSIAERYYAHPEDRRYRDLDILIEQNEIGQAESALASLAFLASPENVSVKTPAWRGERAYVKYLPCELMVELHWDYITSASMRRGRNWNLEEVLQRCERLVSGGAELSAPRLGDQFVGACVHATCGHQWDRLVHLLDIGLMAKHVEGEHLALAEREANRLRVRSVIGLALYRTNEFFPSPQLSRLMKVFAPSALDRCLTRAIIPTESSILSWTPLNRFRRRTFRALLKYMIY